MRLQGNSLRCDTGHWGTVRICFKQEKAAHWNVFVKEGFNASKAQWSLNVPQGLTFNNSMFCPYSALCVLCGSENKQRLFPYTALTDWFV